MLSKRGLRIETAEGFLYICRIVHEVKYVSVLFVGMDAVYAANRLDGFNVTKLLIYHKGVKQRLVESSLVLLGNDEHVAIIMELCLSLALGNPLAVMAYIHSWLRVFLTTRIGGINYRSAESDQNLKVVISLLLHIPFYFVVIAHSRKARCCDDHHLALALYLLPGNRAESLNDDLRLLAQSVRMQLLVSAQ